MDLWSHQEYGIVTTLEAIAAGLCRICLTSPTGGGKSRIICELIRRVVADGWQAVLYTNRRLLIDQLVKVLTASGIPHGVRASGHEDNRELPVQISSLPTERSRTIKRGTWQPHGGEGKCLAVVDEAHLNANDTAQQMLTWHLSRGHVTLGVTATPLGIGALYDHLIVAGTTSELRRCKALVPAVHFGPDEPDLRHIKRMKVGEDLSENENRKAIMLPGVFGRVYDHWRRLNPDGKPTILFGPGVPESLWFAEQFWAQGVTAAHLASDGIWVNGENLPNDDDGRAEVLRMSQSGEVKVLCNRFILREGIDCPWFAHGIFATVFGSLQSYLQSGGRLLRKDTDKSGVIVQDHGGNWHRHGSLNADRTWSLDDTGPIVAAIREERMRQKQETEPSVCPECAAILVGFKCRCGFEIMPGRKSRPVVQVNGSLKYMTGDIYRPRRISTRSDAGREWERIYHRARKTGMTFRQAEALFAAENRWLWPPRTLPLMPVDPHSRDWFAKVKEVPRERLNPLLAREEARA